MALIVPDEFQNHSHGHYIESITNLILLHRKSERIHESINILVVIDFIMATNNHLVN